MAAAEKTLTEDDANAELARMQLSDPGEYARLLSWFRAKRTQIEMVMARGYGDPAPPLDMLRLRDDFEWVYYDATDHSKIGCDVEWEREVFGRFYAHYRNRAAELSGQIAAIPALPRQQNLDRDLRQKLDSWKRQNLFVDALSNVYYSAKRDCYLYVRFTDASIIGQEATCNDLLLERIDSLPISHPGYKTEKQSVGKFVPRICHVIYILDEPERDNRQIKQLQDDKESWARQYPVPSIFFRLDLTANITHHYLNPECELAMGAGSECISTERGGPPKRGTLTADKARRKEGVESEAEDTVEAAGLAKSDLPQMLTSDPIALYLGATHGDVVTITNYPRYNTFVPVVRNYRKVVEGI